MEVREAMQKRRSVRKFIEKEIPDTVISEILHDAMSGPSACNKKPWEFYVVKDPAKREELKTATHYSGIDAPIAIVVCGNLSRALPMQLAEYWIQDCSAATENILLSAVDHELGAVWCGVYPQNRPVAKVQKILGLSEKQIPLNIVYIGFPEEESEPRDQYEEKRVHYI